MDASGRLTARESRVVELFNAGEQPCSIAQFFGVTVWAIYKRLQRARRKCVGAVKREFSSKHFHPLSLSSF